MRSNPSHHSAKPGDPGPRHSVRSAAAVAAVLLAMPVALVLVAAAPHVVAGVGALAVTAWAVVRAVRYNRCRRAADCTPRYCVPGTDVCVTG